MKYCGKCGEQNADEDLFCWKCGSRLHAGGEPVHDSGDEVPGPTESVPAEPASSAPNDANPERKLRIGYSLVDDDHVMYYGKKYNISKENLHEYRTNGLICVVITYVLGFYALFGSGFTYEMGYLGNQSRTLYEIILNDGFDALFSNDIMTLLFVVAVILIVLSIVPVLSLFGGIVLCAIGGSVGTISHDIFGLTVGVDLVETNYVFWIVTILLILVSALGAACLSKYSVHIEMYEGNNWWDVMRGFVTGKA